MREGDIPLSNESRSSPHPRFCIFHLTHLPSCTGCTVWTIQKCFWPHSDVLWVTLFLSIWFASLNFTSNFCHLCRSGCSDRRPRSTLNDITHTFNRLKCPVWALTRSIWTLKGFKPINGATTMENWRETRGMEVKTDIKSKAWPERSLYPPRRGLSELHAEVFCSRVPIIKVPKAELQDNYVIWGKLAAHVCVPSVQSTLMKS